MNAPSHILVALDLTPGGAALTRSSERALSEGITLAKEFGARLDVMHSTAVEAFELTDHYALVHSGVSEVGRDVLDGVMKQLADAEIKGQVVVFEDKPWVAISREVEKHGADLVIVGRRDDDERPGLGRVSKKIVHVCPADVYVVGAGAKLRPSKIVAATDLSDVGARAIEAGAFMARKFSAELHVVHAFQIPISEQMHGDRAEVVKRLKQEATASVEAQIETAKATDIAKLHVGCTTPMRALEDAEKVLKADLIVLGTVSRGGLPGLLIGNVAEKLLAEIRCSLLAVKPADFQSPYRN